MLLIMLIKIIEAKYSPISAETEVIRTLPNIVKITMFIVNNLAIENRWYW